MTAENDRNKLKLQLPKCIILKNDSEGKLYHKIMKLIKS